MDAVSRNILELKKNLQVWADAVAIKSMNKKLIYMMILYSQQIISIIAGKIICIVNMVSPIFSTVTYMNTGADLESLFGRW